MLSALLLLAQPAPPTPAEVTRRIAALTVPANPATLDADARAILALHNRERMRLDQPPLVWNRTLAEHAARYARQIAAEGVARHDRTPFRRRVMGENLWHNPGRPLALTAGIEQMLAERIWFKPGVYPDISTTGDWAAPGHYTQIIWPTTRAIGCAAAQGWRGTMLVCRYSPPGNKDGVRLP